MRYVSVTVRLAASALVAIVAVSMLPPFWTDSSLVAVVVTVLWAGLAASRARRRLSARGERRWRRIAVRRSLARDAFGDLVRADR